MLSPVDSVALTPNVFAFPVPYTQILDPCWTQTFVIRKTRIVAGDKPIFIYGRYDCWARRI
jgi:hypothetical protein